ncbi:MAG: pectinesterase family protein [Paludibacter sp.]|nr:pectinesterase family protein [Paludibacter sp.]
MKKTCYFLIALFVTLSHAYGQVGKTNTRSQSSTALIDAWDFGAEQLDAAVYNNQLTVAVINGWYAGTITPGSVSTTNVFPASFASVGGLSWTGGSNDRLRTTNTALTRYDTNIASAVGYTGRLYQNGAGTTTPARYFTFVLNEDDEVTVVARADAAGKINFTNSLSGQADSYITATDIVPLKFVAKTAGSYKIYDSSGKPSYFRILRKAATYKIMTGTINTTEGADIPAGYGITYTNAAGKSWTATVANDNTYSVTVPSGYNYTVSMANANGYVITTTKAVAVADASVPFDLSIKKVSLFTVSGAISGLGTSISKLSLTFTPALASSYVPEPVINTAAATYTVQLEANNSYIVAAKGVNDYAISDNAIVVAQAAVTKDIVFAPKPVYAVTIDASSLNASQQAALTTTFTNLNESGYTYTFAPGTQVLLRDGTYSIACSGLDAYPLQLALTSNLKVNGAATSKTLAFSPVTNWSFDDATITTSTTSYKGMLFTGTASNEIAKGHLVISGTATVKVPVTPGQKVIVTYYYSANFTVEGGTAITTASNSTTLLETAQYTYPGSSAGVVTIANVSGTTYITDVTVVNTIPYVATITVGPDKNYQSVNDALAAVRAMVRPARERVKIMIDPGNYEEMLVVDVDSVSLINASATPSIGLLGQGVNIDANAVRITSYYGHGYNYYSMGTNQRWSADALRVNKENGYTNYANTGAGTTNNSYWNATVIVSAAGFQAQNIIFENSYNQYVSKKESEDVVVEWVSAGKGTRPTTLGSVAVQNKSFVERAAAIAYTKSGDKSVLYKCRVVGRQDSFYGAEGARVVSYKGSLMGGTDYIFGGMTLVAYMSDLAMNTSETNTDVAYITAAQQTTARGYLMYGCTVTSAKPGTETASTYLSKPGEFGRPWAATTSEVVFYNTTIEATNNPSFAGKSLIAPEAWLNTLSGTSNKCYEYGTIELSGENNQSSRAAWSTVLSTPTLTDATAINTFNFTKGTDNWDPIPTYIALESGGLSTALSALQPAALVQINTKGSQIFISNVNTDTHIYVYAIDGSKLKAFDTNVDVNFSLARGIWIVKARSAAGNKTTKVLIN